MRSGRPITNAAGQNDRAGQSSATSGSRKTHEPPHSIECRRAIARRQLAGTTIRRFLTMARKPPDWRQPPLFPPDPATSGGQVPESTPEEAPADTPEPQDHL